MSALRMRRGGIRVVAFAVAVAVALLIAPAKLPAAADYFDGYTDTLYNQGGGISSGGIDWVYPWGDGGFGQSAYIVDGAIGPVNNYLSFSPYAEFTLDSFAPLESIRSFTPQSNDNALYIYALVSFHGTPGQDSYGGLGLYNNGDEKFLIGQRYNSTTWGVETQNLNGAGMSSTVPLGDFTSTLLLARINQFDNLLTFWVNPDFGLPASDVTNTPAFTFDYGPGVDDLENVRLRGGNVGNGNKWQFDDINVTLDSPFAPEIPEPASVATVVLGSTAHALRRSRRCQ